MLAIRVEFVQMNSRLVVDGCDAMANPEGALGTTPILIGNSGEYGPEPASLVALILNTISVPVLPPAVISISTYLADGNMTLARSAPSLLIT